MDLYYIPLLFFVASTPTLACIWSQPQKPQPIGISKLFGMSLISKVLVWNIDFIFKTSHTPYCIHRYLKIVWHVTFKLISEVFVWNNSCILLQAICINWNFNFFPIQTMWGFIDREIKTEFLFVVPVLTYAIWSLQSLT